MGYEMTWTTNYGDYVRLQGIGLTVEGLKIYVKTADIPFLVKRVNPRCPGEDYDLQNGKYKFQEGYVSPWFKEHEEETDVPYLESIPVFEARVQEALEKKKASIKEAELEQLRKLQEKYES